MAKWSVPVRCLWEHRQHHRYVGRSGVTVLKNCTIALPFDWGLDAMRHSCPASIRRLRAAISMPTSIRMAKTGGGNYRGRELWHCP